MGDFGFHTSLSGFDAGIDRLILAVHAATRTGTDDAVDHVQDHTRRLLALRSHPRGTPTPSPWGQPPAKISGWLRDSVVTEPARETGNGWRGKIGPTAVYGRIQELGGVAGRGHKSKLPSRPYLKPAVDAAIADGSLRRALVEAVAHALH